MSNGINSSIASLLSQTSLGVSASAGRYTAPTPISIDASTLVAAANLNFPGAAAASSASGSSSTSSATTPTPPWSSQSTAPQESDLVKAVQSGQVFFDPSKSQLDAPAGTHQQDYQALFALYQGLTALKGLADSAASSGVSSAQQAVYQQTFAKGMTQLQTYLSSDAFKTIDVAQGAIQPKQQSTTGATQETDSVTSRPLTTSLSTPLDSLSGEVAFTMQVKSLNGTTKTVNFNLDDMGSTPRSLGNVINYLNGQLQTAGVETRFTDVRNAGTAQTVTVNGQNQTVSTSADTFSLKMKGTPLEKVTFTAADASPAIYLASSQGGTGQSATSVTTDPMTGQTKVTTTPATSDGTQQLTKLDAGSDAVATSVGDGLVFNNAIANAPTAVRATATGPDGSVYVLGDIAGKTDDGQTINGTSDVALMKYDAAGNLLFTQTLGAANAANGYALTVSPDGTQVAVAGTTTGPLDNTDSLQGKTDTAAFLTVYSSEGDEEWTQTRASTAGEQPTAVAFGGNGQVIVTGTVQGSTLGGGGKIGGQDGYIQTYTGKLSTAADGTKSWVSTMGSALQFGSTGVDTPTGVAVNGSSLYVAGTENGHAVVRQYTLQTSGAPTLAATQDLGDLQGGEVAGLSIAADGSVVVAGATHNGALTGGTIGQAYTSGKEGYVATLSAGLTPQSLNYFSAGGDLTAKSMTLSNGQLYLAGAVTQSPKPGQLKGSAAYVAQVDPSSGAVSWSRTLQGVDGIDTPTSIAVAQGGASNSLDALGLPTGAVDYSKPTTLISGSSVRAGDQFTLQVGGGLKQTITVQLGDTYVSLAAEINRLGGFQVKASTTTVQGKTVLQVQPLNQRTVVTLGAGPSGRDALAPLGLIPGSITLDAQLGSVSPSGAAEGGSTRSVLGLNLSPSLNISTSDGAKAAQQALSVATSKIENLYQDMTSDSSSSSTATKGNQTPLSATMSAYYSSQLASYQLALSRLGVSS